MGFTITTDDEQWASLFEPGASPVKKRIRGLEKLQAAGIRTFVFMGPLLPGDPEKLVAELEGKVEENLLESKTSPREMTMQGVPERTPLAHFRDTGCDGFVRVQEQQANLPRLPLL